MTEKETIRRWAQTWKEFGPELEEIRLREVRDEDNLLSLSCWPERSIMQRAPSHRANHRGWSRCSATWRNSASELHRPAGRRPRDPGFLRSSRLVFLFDWRNRGAAVE